MSLMRGVSLWLPSKVGGAPPSSSSSVSEGASNEIESLASSTPPYFSRINTAKLLLEVHEYDVSAALRYTALWSDHWYPIFQPRIWLILSINFIDFFRLRLRYWKVFFVRMMRLLLSGTSLGGCTISTKMLTQQDSTSNKHKL